MGLFDGMMGSLGDFLSGGNQKKATAATQASVDALQNLQTPDVEQMVIQLEELVLQGQLTPEQAQAIILERSAMNDISTDPNLKQNQLHALNALVEISDSGGMTAADLANLNKIKTQEDTAARGAREAILQNAQARGVGGSGLELMAQLQNQQASATRQSQRDMDIAAQAQARALEALQQAGNMSDQMQNTEFNQKAQIASANDAIAKFNAANQQQVHSTNVAANNAAQAANLTAKQKIADSNVATRNAQQQYNKQLAQQDFENQYKKAGGTSNALSNQATAFQAAGDANQKLIGTGVTALAAMSDEREKEDIEPFDPSSFLDSITGYKYKYKNPKRDGKGVHASPMAQDLEATPEGRSMVFEDENGNKNVDYGKGFGTILAALADVHNRVKDLEEK